MAGTPETRANRLPLEQSLHGWEDGFYGQNLVSLVLGEMGWLRRRFEVDGEQDVVLLQVKVPYGERQPNSYLRRVVKNTLGIENMADVGGVKVVVGKFIVMNNSELELTQKFQRRPYSDENPDTWLSLETEDYFGKIIGPAIAKSGKPGLLILPAYDEEPVFDSKFSRIRLHGLGYRSLEVISREGLYAREPNLEQFFNEIGRNSIESQCAMLGNSNLLGTKMFGYDESGLKIGIEEFTSFDKEIRKSNLLRVLMVYGAFQDLDLRMFMNDAEVLAIANNWGNLTNLKQLRIEEVRAIRDILQSKKLALWRGEGESGYEITGVFSEIARMALASRPDMHCDILEAGKSFYWELAARYSSDIRARSYYQDRARSIDNALNSLNRT